MTNRAARDVDALARLRRARADVERQIAEAAERGEFDGLRGAGRPLPRDPDEAAGDAWAAAHVLRSAEAAPEWVELRQSILRERESLARRARAHRDWLAARRAALARVPAELLLEHAHATRRADERFRGDLDAAVRELNGAIARHNLLVRADALQLFPLSVERLIEAADRDERA